MSKSPVTCHSRLSVRVVNIAYPIPVLDSSTGKPAPEVRVSLVFLSNEEGNVSELAQGCASFSFNLHTAHNYFTE